MTYFVLTFTVTWSLWLASGIASPAGPHGPWFLLGVFAPGLIALGLTARCRRRRVSRPVERVAASRGSCCSRRRYHRRSWVVRPARSWVGAGMRFHDRGSLLPVMLLHAAVNNTKDIVPSADPSATNLWALSHSGVGWLTVGLLWLVAGYCLVRMREIPRLTRDTAESAAT